MSLSRRRNRGLKVITAMLPFKGTLTITSDVINVNGPGMYLIAPETAGVNDQVTQVNNTQQGKMYRFYKSNDDQVIKFVIGGNVYIEGGGPANLNDLRDYFEGNCRVAGEIEGFVVNIPN